jgi:homoserine dehydrogenase
MGSFNLCLLGFGNVNRTLVDLLWLKNAELRDRYGIQWRIAGVASRRLGWWANPEGFDVRGLLRVSTRSPSAGARRVFAEMHGEEYACPAEWLRAAQADVLFEGTSLNVETGQPAIDHIRAGLEYGAHAITANKGPIVHAYRELRDLAVARQRQFFFESTVMDGVPIFSLFRNTLPAIEVRGFKGILNSTTNIILNGLEEGLSFDDSLHRAQQLGVAETDATADIEGWDAAVKVAALVSVVMDVRMLPQEVKRQGIGELSGEAVREARAAGRPYKLVCRATRNGSGVNASVLPEQLPLTDPMALVAGTSSIIQFETDVFPGLTITEENPGLYATAYGMMTDFIRAAGR